MPLGGGFSMDAAIEVAAQHAAGRTLLDICNDDGMPPRSDVQAWLLRSKAHGAPDDLKEFGRLWEEAERLYALSLLDDVVTIADDGMNDYVLVQGTRSGIDQYIIDHEAISRSRLRIDTRFQWLKARAPQLLRGGIDAGGTAESMMPPINVQDPLEPASESPVEDGDEQEEREDPAGEVHPVPRPSHAGAG
jgi:hypothetical protein